MPNQQILSSTYGQKVRVRVCGVLVTEKGLLMAQHRPFGPAGELWLPPGGGINFLEDARAGLVREFLEETNLQISPGQLLFMNEMIRAPYHSIELFFEVAAFEGAVSLGIDPEMPADKQILQQVKFLSESEINSMPLPTLHNVFQYLHNKDGKISFDSLLNLKEKYISNT